MRQQPSEATRAMLASVWVKNRDLILQRLLSIEGFCRQLPASVLDAPMREQASSDAHKLAGSLGMFGLGEGTTVAREIEHRLRDADPNTILQANIPRLASKLRGLIESFELRDSKPEPVRPRRLLLVEHNAELAQAIASEAERRNITPSIVPGLPEAKTMLQEHPYELVLLDLSTDAHLRPEDDHAEQIRELLLSRSPMQVLALTSQDTFEDRVTAAQIGAHGFLPNTAAPAEIINTCENLLDLQTTQFHVLALDDDPSVLHGIDTLLQALSIRVTTVEDPNRFWPVLREAEPDLVILDRDLPNSSGIEICRAIRNDAEWNRLPVVILSSSSDADAITSIYSSGADDFVLKPIIDVELTTRVRNRLERDRLYRNLSDYDQLTTVRNRRSSNVVIANYLRLAERHGLPVSLVIVDLDKFKRVNDIYGHQSGDDVLQHLGILLRQSFRSEDVVARWGGEEFIVAMFAMRRADAVERMANVLERLEAHEFEAKPGVRFRVSFSAGLAEFPADGKDLHTLYKLADVALYRAKSSGGRRIYSGATESADDRTDVAIVSPDVALAAPLRHLLEMRGCSVELYGKPEEAVKTWTAGAKLLPRAVLIDDATSSEVLNALARLRTSEAEDGAELLLLVDPAQSADGLPAHLPRIPKPVKGAVIMQRLRRALSR